MTFDASSFQLPVFDVIEEIRKKLATNQTLILSAPPGAGKSTLVPLVLMNEPWLQGKKILMLEPRRLAARSVANRMASMLGEEAGQTIGYAVRFERASSNNTVVEVLTEGILTRMLHQDKRLADVGLVIFDEFHERSIHADVAMAFCRETQKTLRPDLKILVMSATLDMPQLSELLEAPVVESQGKRYPVKIHYTGQSDMDLLPELTARIVKKAVRENEGDLLVFLPGQGEILQCQSILKRELKGFSIHALYGQLPYSRQLAAIKPDKNGKRKIVLSTSIAETSLTIEGVKVVVDSGFGKVSRFDPKTELSRLVTVKISKDSADQRAGRAGRLSPGVCYRMWSEEAHEDLNRFRIPEILETDLAALVLDMAHWGVKEISKLTWLTQPPKVSLYRAERTLENIDSIEDGKITEHGKSVYKLPCHPRIAHMLIQAEKEDKIGLAADLAALLEERDPLGPAEGVDINERIIALRNFRASGGKNKRMARIEKVSQSYRKLFDIEPDNDTDFDPFESGLLLANAYPERIACSRPGNNAQFQLANGALASFHHKDELAFEQWLTVSHVDARKGMGKIFMASPLNPKDLTAMIKEKEITTWDLDSGTLSTSINLCIGGIVLRSTPLPESDNSKATVAKSEALRKHGEELLNFTDEFTQWQNRVLSLGKWNPNQGWPDVNTQTILMINHEWLSPHLKDVNLPSDLYSLDLLKIVSDYFLNSRQKKLLDQLAPEQLEQGDDLNFPIQYFTNGQTPWIKVDLKTLKNFSKNPVINDGRQKVNLFLNDQALNEPVLIKNVEKQKLEIKKLLSGKE